MEAFFPVMSAGTPAAGAKTLERFLRIVAEQSTALIGILRRLLARRILRHGLRRHRPSAIHRQSFSNYITGVLQSRERIQRNILNTLGSQRQGAGSDVRILQLPVVDFSIPHITNHGTVFIKAHVRALVGRIFELHHRYGAPVAVNPVNRRIGVVTDLRQVGVLFAARGLSGSPPQVRWPNPARPAAQECRPTR